MADPFSIIAGSAGLLDVCWRVFTYLKNVQAAAARVEEEITALLHEIEALILVNESIKDVFAAELKGSAGASVADPARLENLWRNTGRILEDCRATVEKLEELVKTIIGKEGSKVGRFDGFRKQARKQSKDEDFLQLRRQLTNYQGALQLLLTALNLSYTHRSQNMTDVSLDQLSEDVQVLGLNLKSQIAALQPTLGSTHDNSLRDSIKSAAAVAPFASLNKHFDIPQAVSSIFTGKEALLDELKSAFDGSSSPGLYHTQKRFVCFGLGGSGKTQFACKFAQDNRKNFWGIFWIDASSEESAKHTFSRIAKVGGVEPNERAAKNWLSSLEYPWLLVIDSVDDPKISIEKFFPEGERGHILVTTRNPAHQVHGTVGSRFCHFGKLEYNDANNLLLKAACEPRPWTSATKRSAALITKALGFLPLALIHAGRAIMNHLCTLANYLNFYEKSWQRIRRARTFSGDDINMNVYSSYEIIYQGLEATKTEEAKDAVQLLKMFSFLHCENIRVDVLLRAATNPRLEREEQAKEEILQRTMSGASKPKPWTQALKELAIRVVIAFYQDRSRAILPTVLREIETLGSFDDLRLRVALKELTQLSLITYHQISDSYSMHPLVSTWVRERPQMSTAEQALWCQAAATILAQCILLPPLGATESEEDLRRDLLPHVDHVQKRQREIQMRFDNNQRLRSIYKRPWPVPAPVFDRGRALQLAKFSLIYSQCGDWDEAEKLQLPVKDFVCKMLGMEHPVTMRIVLALAGTYWQQTRGNEAAELQDQVLQACITSLGPDHQKTLKAMDTLGGSRCYQGRYKEALALHERALKGMTRTLGADHEDTLLAIDNLGRVQYRYFRFDVAKDLHAKAVAGMTKVLGPTHMDTLNAIDNLAMTYLELGGELLKPAHEMMLQVFEQRQKKLGKEHPYTLLAICNLARIKSALGDMDEAERLMRAALPIAERNLGENHFGTLSGRVHLAQVHVRQKRYSEAEDIFMDVIQCQRYRSAARDGEHPDRIIAMWYLLQCYQVQGKINDAIGMCDEISDGLSTIGGHGHPFATRLLDRRKALLELKIAGSIPTAEPSLNIGTES